LRWKINVAWLTEDKPVSRRFGCCLLPDSDGIGIAKCRMLPIFNNPAQSNAPGEWKHPVGRLFAQ